MLREERWFLVFATVQNGTCVDINKIHDGNKPHLLMFNATFFISKRSPSGSLITADEAGKHLSLIHKTGLE